MNCIELGRNLTLKPRILTEAEQSGFPRGLDCFHSFMLRCGKKGDFMLMACEPNLRRSSLISYPCLACGSITAPEELYCVDCLRWIRQCDLDDFLDYVLAQYKKDDQRAA